MIIWWWSLRYNDDGDVVVDDDNNDGDVVVDDDNNDGDIVDDDDDNNDGDIIVVDDGDDNDGDIVVDGDDNYLCFWIGMSGILFNAEYMALWTKASDKDLVICCTSALLLYAET